MSYLVLHLPWTSHYKILYGFYLLFMLHFNQKPRNGINVLNPNIGHYKSELCVVVVLHPILLRKV